MGGALRDLFYLNTGFSANLTYGLIFALSAVGLAVSVAILARVDVIGFAKDAGRAIRRVEAQTAGAD